MMEHEVKNPIWRIPSVHTVKKTTKKQKNTRLRAFYTCVGCETKTGVVRILVIFKTDLAVLWKSRRDLVVDVAERNAGSI